MPRLRRALGPASLVGQLPVIVTSPATSIPALASGAARGARTAVVTSIAGAAVIAGGVAGVTAIGTKLRANQHSELDRTARRLPQSERSGASRCGDGATRGRSAQHVAQCSVTNRRLVERFVQPAVRYHRAGGDTHGGRQYLAATSPTRGSTAAHHLLAALPVASPLPIAVPALANPPLPLDVPLPSALPTE